MAAVTGAVVLRLERDGLRLMQILRRFLQCERGATAIEYAIIAGSIALAIIAAVKSIGTPLSDTFTSVASSVK